MSLPSPHEAKRNAGRHRPAARTPDYAALHPGYATAAQVIV
jgi:hypothetical protein